MDKELIAEIVKLQAGQWTAVDTALVLAMVLTAAVSVGAAYLGPYLAKKAENKALREDFADLKRQLAENTRVTELLKTEIQFQDWTTREWMSLRTKRLEEILDVAGSTLVWLEKLWEATTKGQVQPQSPDPSGRMRILQVLYFAELRGQVIAYLLAHHEAKRVIHDVQSETLQAWRHNPAACIDQMWPLVSEKLNMVQERRHALENAAVGVIAEVFGDRAAPQDLG